MMKKMFFEALTLRYSTWGCRRTGIENQLRFYMRYHLFLYYEWFLQNLRKDFIQTNMQTTVFSVLLLILKKICISSKQTIPYLSMLPFALLTKIKYNANIVLVFLNFPSWTTVTEADCSGILWEFWKNSRDIWFLWSALLNSKSSAIFNISSIFCAHSLKLLSVQISWEHHKKI